MILQKNIIWKGVKLAETEALRKQSIMHHTVPKDSIAAVAVCISASSSNGKNEMAPHAKPQTLHEFADSREFAEGFAELAPAVHVDLQENPASLAQFSMPKWQPTAGTCPASCVIWTCMNCLELPKFVDVDENAPHWMGPE